MRILFLIYLVVLIPILPIPVFNTSTHQTPPYKPLLRNTTSDITYSFHWFHIKTSTAAARALAARRQSHIFAGDRGDRHKLRHAQCNDCTNPSMQTGQREDSYTHHASCPKIQPRRRAFGPQKARTAAQRCNKHTHKNDTKLACERRRNGHGQPNRTAHVRTYGTTIYVL